MRRLLAVGVTESWTGDWQTTQGNERAIVAAPIGVGERVWLEVESPDLVETFQLSAIPLVLNLERSSRYRVVKDCSGAASHCPTSVEVILSNGSASS